MGNDRDNSSFSMIDLFRTEVAEQGKILTEGLLALEVDPTAAVRLEALMRAAHSVKGAARLVGIEPVVRIAHVVEDVFVAAQNSELTLNSDHIDVLLGGVDTIIAISCLPEKEIADWATSNQNELDTLLKGLAAIRQGAPVEVPVAVPVIEVQVLPPAKPPGKSEKSQEMASIDPTGLNLFRIEVVEQKKILSDGLLALEENPSDADRFEALMRSAHSIKGAARMVGLEPVVQLAHVIEDVFVAAQSGALTLAADDVDVLLTGIDSMASFSKLSIAEIATWNERHGEDHEKMLGTLSNIGARVVASPAAGEAATTDGATMAAARTRVVPPVSQMKKSQSGGASAAEQGGERVLRVTAERWNQLMGLAGEVKVEAGWLHPYVASLSKLKRRQIEMTEILDTLRATLLDMRTSKVVVDLLLQAQCKMSECRSMLVDQTSSLDAYDRRINNLSEKLHRETIKTRMRPFSDGVNGFQRMTRDIAKSLGKKVKLEIVGLSVQVDRDVLEKMEAPLNHILRNALDHGIESPADRIKAGKQEQATIRITAVHSDGMLSIMIDDDGRGIDIERLRRKVTDKKLVTSDMAAKLSEEELLEFLFLPSFSTKEEVTDISGRGVGLDVVLSTLQEMHGSVETTTKLGEGTRFNLRLPLTMSVVSSLIAEISGEPYAFPLARIIHVVKLQPDEIDVVEDHQFLKIDGENIGLVGASQVLGLGAQPAGAEEMSVVIIGSRHNRCGVVVDKLLGQMDLAVQPLDIRLGKIRGVSAAAVLEDGSPILILDIDDMALSVDSLIKKGGISKITSLVNNADKSVRRILIVDDSMTVRELERHLLENAGYQVDVAVDGVDGWNAIRTFKQYDLVITDVDMPRMDGIELVRLIKSDKSYSALPVIIVSYKEREADRRRGMEAGADFYLTKGGFHDNSLLEAVADLIGEIEV